MEVCCICSKSFEDGQPSAVLTQKGCDNINRIASSWSESIIALPGNRVHQKCRLDLVRRNKTNAVPCSVLYSPIVSRRSTTPQFNSKEHCIFCGQTAKYDGKKRGFGVIPVRTRDFQSSITEVCKERSDEWSEIVLSRLEFAQDLHAADTVYHQTCSINFRTGKQVPKQYGSDSSDKAAKKPKLGRPVDNAKNSAFMKVMQYLVDNDEEQITVGDLTKKMGEYLEGNEEGYSAVYMKAKLQEYFGDRIVITNIKNRANVVTFQRTAASLINEFYCQPKSEDNEDEKSKIIETAAKLIKSEIKNMTASNDNYPSNTEMASIEETLAFLPVVLQVFLRNIFAGKDVNLKIASIGQAIIQATRPRAVLAPLQLGLGVQMHHHFASKFLLDSLHAHGFCASYNTVQNYERSAAVTQGTDIPEYAPDRFVQYVADNVDHNSRTLDGSGTFHGMGIIATITPGTMPVISIPKKDVTADEIAAAGRIEIHHYIGPQEDSPRLVYKELQSLRVTDTTANLDLLWKISQPLLRSPRPAWSGTMQMICHGSYPGQSSVMFLPMIDLDPSDMTCIYSTLSFIAEQAYRYRIVPVVTFDQPLWWKAQMIVLNEPEGNKLKSIVLRLGGLHIQMSFLGCIGHLMGGSGLEDVLELVYAKNAVGHMLSGKAIARAIRGHFLVDAALNTLLVCQTFNVPLPVSIDEDGKSESQDDHADLEEEGEAAAGVLPMDDDMELARKLFEDLIENPTNDLECSSEVFERIAKKFEDKRGSMLSLRTAVLWMKYMSMVEILKKFIKAERTGNWTLHLQSVHEMLPYFAAAGHNLYTKSAYIYLQKMHDLQQKHPALHRSFLDGLHVVRRSDRFWAGLSTDLIIEQVLMRSVKTSGGLTRGRGMSETQRLVWLMSMPACAEVNNAMQSLTNTVFHTSDQHKDTTQARKERDHKDTCKIVVYFSQRNPFTSDPTLRSIATGVVAEEGVNCDKAKEEGDKILATMIGKNAYDYSFRKKDQVKTLSSKTAVQFSDGKVQVDPQLLFQRLSIVATSGQYDNPRPFFHYEMCSFPTALFDASLLPKKANKPVLADAIWSSTKDSQTAGPIGDAHFVIDGGALLHRVPWPRGSSYDTICSIYVQYVVRKYGKPTVIFDGYENGPSTKDCTHRRRIKACGPAVVFDCDMLITFKKEEFLSNSANKQRFINLLADRLEQQGCSIHHASGDADLLIVQEAIKAARSTTTVLIGDDTDLLVLLCHHGEMDAHDLYFKPESKQRTGTHRVWNIKKTKAALGRDVCLNILFVHALLGCDTTSRVHGIGKGVALKKITRDAQFLDQATIFNSTDVTKDAIITAGEKALLCLYNSGFDDSLDSLRYTRFCQKVVTGNTCVQPENLPPTAAAASFHSLRVYLQVQQWKGISLNPEDWGWMLEDGNFLPVRTHLPPAHAALLEMIRCNCKTDCNSRRCSCKKHGLDCSAACGLCKGQSCANSSRPDLDLDGDPDDR